MPCTTCGRVFRRMYPACYTPLLADRQAADDWQAVLQYSQEALEVAHSHRPVYYLRAAWDRPDITFTARLPGTGLFCYWRHKKAFELYRPAFDETPCFETYAQARQLADAVSTERGAHLQRRLQIICGNRGSPTIFALPGVPQRKSV